MGHKHTKDEILAGALAVANACGLSALTFGRVAKHLGVNDRIVVYYFPTKDDLVGDVLVAMGAQLQEALAAAFSTPAADHLDLLGRAWPVLARPGADPVFALFFEAAGLAATGREPYRTLVPLLVDAWVDWTAGFLEGTRPAGGRRPRPRSRRSTGCCCSARWPGRDVARRAARTLGIRSGR